MEPEHLVRLLNSLHAAKRLADELGDDSELEFERRFRMLRDISEMIRTCEKWQELQVKKAAA